MTNEQIWVESYLDRYCPLLEHDFRAAGGGVRWCVRCYKEEAGDSSSCSVCDCAATTGTLLMAPGWDAPLQTRLCATCFAGLTEETDRRLWRTDEASLTAAAT